MSIIKLRSTIHRGQAAAVLVAALCAVTVSAQVPDAEKPVKPTTTHDFTSTSQLIGSNIYLGVPDPGAETPKGEKTDRSKAEATDWLVDTSTGQLTHAVVSVGGFLGIGDKTVLIPVEDLKWSDTNQRYELSWTKDQLKARPAFDLDKAVKAGLDKSCSYTKGTGVVQRDKEGREIKDPTKEGREIKEAGEASTKRDPVATMGLLPPTNCLAKASDLDDSKVQSGGKEWGKVRDLIVDRKENRVVLAVVRHNGDDYLVRGDQLHPCQDKDGDHFLCTERTSEQLAASTRFEKPKKGVVDPAAAEIVLASRD